VTDDSDFVRGKKDRNGTPFPPNNAEPDGPEDGDTGIQDPVDESTPSLPEDGNLAPPAEREHSLKLTTDLFDPEELKREAPEPGEFDESLSAEQSEGSPLPCTEDDGQPEGPTLDDISLEEVLNLIKHQFGEGTQDRSCYEIDPNSPVIWYRTYRDRLVDNKHTSLHERYDQMASGWHDNAFEHFYEIYSRTVFDVERRVHLSGSTTVRFHDFVGNVSRALAAVDEEFDFDYVKLMRGMRDGRFKKDGSMTEEEEERVVIKEFLAMVIEFDRENLKNSNPDFLFFFDCLVRYDEMTISEIEDRQFTSTLLRYKKQNLFRRLMITRLGLENNESRNLAFLMMNRGYHFSHWFVDPKNEVYQTSEMMEKTVGIKKVPFTNGVIYRYQNHYAKIDCDIETVEEHFLEFDLGVKYLIASAILTEYEINKEGRYTILGRTRLEPEKIAVKTVGHPWNAREFWDLTKEDFDRFERERKWGWT